MPRREAETVEETGGLDSSLLSGCVPDLQTAAAAAAAAPTSTVACHLASTQQRLWARRLHGAGPRDLPPVPPQIPSFSHHPTIPSASSLASPSNVSLSSSSSSSSSSSMSSRLSSHPPQPSAAGAAWNPNCAYSSSSSGHTAPHLSSPFSGQQSSGTSRWVRLPRLVAVAVLFVLAACTLPHPVTGLEAEALPAGHKRLQRNAAGLNNDNYLHGDTDTNNNKNFPAKNNDNGFKKSNILDKNNLINHMDQGNAAEVDVREPADELGQGKLRRGEDVQADPLQQLAAKQKQRAADAAAQTARRNAEIQQQIADHEKKFAARQQEMEERERQRLERERILAEKRLLMKKEQDEERDPELPVQHGNPQRKAAGLPELSESDKQHNHLNQPHRRAAAAAEMSNRGAGNIPKKGAFRDTDQQAFHRDRGGMDGAADGAVLTNKGRESGTKDKDAVDQAMLVPPVKYKQGAQPAVEPALSSHEEPAHNKGVYDAHESIAAGRKKDRQRELEADFRETTRGANLSRNNNVNEVNKDGEPRQENRVWRKENAILGIPIEQPKEPTIGNPNPYNVHNNNNNNVYSNDFHGRDANHWNNNNNQDSFNNGGGYQQQQQQQQQQYHQPEQSPIGGMNLAWDWEDFAISFNNYGGAEMKVRRAPHPSTGEPWPMPQYYSKKDNKVYRVSRDLKLVPTKVNCDILEEGLSRHLQRILRGAVEDMYDNLQNADGTFIEDPAPKYQRDEYLRAPMIARVEIRVRNSCSKYPALASDESYDLVVKKKKTYIWANEVWGALRGLETFGQLVWRGTNGHLYIKETVISDYPRFPHRGLHIDTSRHFLFKEILLDIIDSMEMNKLNVFHWHIVDDQSFPYESKAYPELSRKGAFHPSYVYSLEDIADIIEYARLRGVRVMPEFDTPGHTYSWGLSRPELLTQCYSMDRIVKGYLGPIDPSKNATYRFLDTLFQEIVDVFQDTYLHLGGDEVPLGCWQSNPEVMAFAAELAKQPKVTSAQTAQTFNNYAFSMWSDDIKRLYEYYENRLIKILTDIAKKKKRKIKYVMWQEVMNNNLQLPNDTIIQVWMGDMADVSRAISMGYQVLYSTCWYLDHIEYGTKWPKYYQCDPADNSYGYSTEDEEGDDEEDETGYHIDESKVLGGEIAFWSEYFSNENLIPLMWPRASAGAERLWSNKEVKNLDKAAERLSEHRCRMIKRGINAGEISGPGYCLHAPPKRRVFNETAACKGGNCTGRSHNIVQIEDIELHLRQRGGSIADCGSVFSRGNTGLLLLLLIVLILVVGGAGACTLSRPHSRLHRVRLCRHRSVLFVFVAVLLVYFLCYTTIWMRAFEFSGSFHKTFQEDSGNGAGYGGDQGNAVVDV